MRIEVASSKDQKGERQRQQKVNTVSKVPVERVKMESRERERNRVLHSGSCVN